MAKKTEEPVFNIEEAIINLQCPEMFKAGLKYYIESNKLTPKDEKEFNKMVTEFNNLKIGD